MFTRISSQAAQIGQAQQAAMRFVFWLLSALLIVFSFSLQAATTDAVAESKQTEFGLYLTPQEVWDTVNADPDGVLFIDVRTRAEAMYVGMPTVVDALVPVVDHDPFWPWDDERNGYQLELVQDFIVEIERRLADKQLDKDAPIILMCRSGGRSAMAADRLADEGFTQVYTVPEGFEGDKSKSGADKGQRTVNGWKNAGLPWMTDLDKDKMFFEKQFD